MRLRAAALGLSFLLAPVAAHAQYPDPYFQPAQEAFLNLKPDTRLWFQIFLTSAGHWPAVPNMGYSRRLFEATKQFQLSRGELPTGVLTETQVNSMLGSAAPVLEGWRLRWVPHPVRGRQLWVPMGLDLDARRTDLGVEMKESANRFRMKFNYIAAADVRTAYEATLRELSLIHI